MEAVWIIASIVGIAPLASEKKMLSRLLNEYATDIERALYADDGLAEAYLVLTANSLRNLAKSLRDEAHARSR